MLSALEWVGIIWVCGGLFIPLCYLGDWISDQLDRRCDPRRGSRAKAPRPPATLADRAGREATVKRSPETWTESPGMKDAIERLRSGRRVRPTESDAPPISTFPSPKHKPLEGQLRLEPPQS